MMQEEKLYDECLDNIREKILILLAQHEELDAGQVSRFLGAGTEFSSFHLEELRKSGMVTECSSSGNRVSWKIAQHGQGYLVHHGMLS